MASVFRQNDGEEQGIAGAVATTDRRRCDGGQCGFLGAHANGSYASGRCARSPNCRRGRLRCVPRNIAASLGNVSDVTTSEPVRFPLEPDRQQREQWLAAFSAFVQGHLDDLATAPAVGTVGAAGREVAAGVRAEIGEAPIEGGATAVVERLATAVAASFNTAGPGYMAYIPGGGLYATALADFVADSLNRYTGISQAAPALLALEYDVTRWIAREFGFDERARGLLLSGGSLANFTAIVTARHHRFGDRGDWRDAVAYVSDQVHHSNTKAFRLAGIPPSNVRFVAADDRYRLDPDALRAAVLRDRSDGLEPFVVISSAGTTNTGAVDPLAAIADVCDELGVWHHVDAAYGGGFVLCSEGKRRLDGISRADSVTFDPHKGMFLPYGTGCLLVRDGQRLRAANRLDAEYLQDIDGYGELEIPSPAEYGPELTRSFRGLRVWLPLVLHGATAFRDAAAEKLALAEQFHAGLVARIDAGAPLEIVDVPQLSIVPFRCRAREGESLEQWNQRTEALHRGIIDRRRVYLSSTMLPSSRGPVFTTRICVLSFRTHAERIDMALDDLDAALAELT